MSNPIIGIDKPKHKRKDTPEEWTSPVVDVPHDGEIVVIACITEGGQKLQTAIYQQVEDDKGQVREMWHCGEPFSRLMYWLRMPEVPAESIVSLKGFKL